MRSQVSVVVVVAVAALFSGCPQAVAPAGPPVRLELVPAALLLPSVGATDTLRVKAFDAEGREAAVTGATFTASGSAVSVDGTGLVTAAALGTGRVSVTLGDLQARASVVVAEPAAGAVLVSDAQVVGDIRPVDLAATLAPGYRYAVTLTGVTASVGDLLIGTGALPVGGRVVAVDGDAVTLELVTLDELFPRFELDETLTLADEAFELNPAVTDSFDVVRQPSGAFTFTLKDGVQPRGTSRKKTKGPSGKFEFEVGPVECAIEASAFQLSIAKLEFTFDPGLSLERKWSEDEKRVVVTSNAKASFVMKPVLQSQLEGKLTCELEVGSVPLPLPGPIGLVLGFSVPFGVGFEIEVKTPVAPGVSLEFKKELQATAHAGFTCIFGDCTIVGDFTDSSPPAMGPTFPPPVLLELPTDVKVEASGYIYGFAKLAFGSSAVLKTVGGAAGWRRLEAELAAVKVGLKVEAKYATELAQARDPAYANEYRLLFEAGLEAGGGLESFILFVKFTPLKLEAKFILPLATSPKGTLSVSPATFDTTDTLTFDVALQPEALSFPVIGYNARRVTIYKKVDSGADLSLVEVASGTFTEGQRTARLTHLAGSPGSARDYVAFLETNFLSPLTIELDPGTALELTVNFGSSIAATAATPLTVEAQFRDLKTNTTTPAAGVTITVSSMDASATAMSNLTDMNGRFTAQVRPNTGASLVFLDIGAEAPNGATAKASVSAMVTMGPVCNAASPRMVASLILESETDVLAAADVGIADSLQIRGTGAPFAVDLPCLATLQTFNATGSAVTSINLPSLNAVTAGNSLVVYGTTNLTSLRLPRLTRAEGGIQIGRWWGDTNPPTTFPNAALTEVVIGAARLGTNASFDISVSPLLTDLSGISSGLWTRAFFYGRSLVGSGFGRTEALALANRITVTNQVCESDGVTLPTCFTGPPWAP